MNSSAPSFSGSKNGSEFDQDHVSVYSDTPLGSDVLDDLPSTQFVPDTVNCSPDLSKRLDGDHSAEENDFSNAVLKYINQVLMEDDLDPDKSSSISDSTLHAAEKSFYEILNKTHPSSPNQWPPHDDASSGSAEQSDGVIEETQKVRTSGNSGTIDGEKNCSKEKDEGDLEDSLLVRGRKSLHRGENEIEEGRGNKQLAMIHGEQSVLHEIFDDVLSLYGKNEDSALNREYSQQQQNQHELVGEMVYTRKGISKREAVDLRSFLIQCAQSVGEGDQRNAFEQLKQIRLRSSPFGDGAQRLVHYFTNSLEARLLGSGNSKSEHKALAFITTPDADVLRACKLYISVLPFMETSYFFATKMIMELAEKSTRLHIIHFGIVYGIEWPPLIQALSKRPGGPPKLRITGIDLPEAGFRPTARVKETGCHLANYCERFGVPFEYNGIAQKWETVGVEDLKIKEDEVLVTYCMCLFKNQVDDTVMEESPRDTVLKLIRSVSPDIFIHGVVNGTYSSPFFTSRFREALFHFSALFDMFEATVPRENPDRLLLERVVWGREILNVVACEGLERIARPETYKQWQVRTQRAGFKQVPLNREIVNRVKAKVSSSYHKDFFVGEVNRWMLQGWKGRVLFALSCWEPQ